MQQTHSHFLRAVLRALVMVPAVIWLYYTGDIVWGTVLLVFTLVAGTIDQVIRPILIRRGADLPLLLIFAGVIGGLIAFGFLGIFIGPTVLAVTYTLLNAWIAEGSAENTTHSAAVDGRDQELVVGGPTGVKTPALRAEVAGEAPGADPQLRAGE